MYSNVHRKYVLVIVAKFREIGTRKLETVCGVSRRSDQRILNAHSFHPYKIHLVQELNDDDFDRRLQFCEDMNQRFPDRWIGRRGAIEWPPRSPDLSTLDFFMWGHVKSKIFATQPTSLEDLRQRIVNEWIQVTPQILQNVRQQHFRAIIYYNFQRQSSQQEFQFKRGRVSISGDPRVGAPKTAVTQKNVDALRKVIIEDRHVTYREIETSLTISKTSIQKNLHEELGQPGVNWCQKTLDRFNSGNSKNAYSIVSGDESWIYCYEPENKRQSAVWMFQVIIKEELNREHFRAIIYYNFQRQLSQQECLAELLLSDDPRVGAPKTAVTQENIEASLKITKTSIQKKLHEELGVRKLVSQQKAARVNWCQKTPTKVIRSRSVSKKMVATFVSKADHIANFPLNEQRAVTADWYTTICLPKVITELRKINPERRIILHQDKASSHTVQKTRQYLMEENVELLDHPPYGPDLSPKDFFNFPKIKNRLRGQRFQSPEEAVDVLKNAVLDLPSNEWKKCFENWFYRMQICINLRGEYFEKQ
ncbi:unnamed protein product [Acanthoscelides obtectus]|uniref:Transposase n=1 Tax=Acanthoscelides obtectus TaxID=200917 RepID=A0A9P0LNX5_ACAOB|nr:unnamed protein product [Acanthoscelides obtectus]CAK1660026.1 Histone-lysine N-methyltransferase SETMAR [Acanthoscelides obtectus]